MSQSKLEFKEKIEIFNLAGVTHTRTQNSHGEIFWDTVKPTTSYRYNPNQGWRKKTETREGILWIPCECPYPEDEYQKL